MQGMFMTVRETTSMEGIDRVGAAPPTTPAARALRSDRRLPAPSDWPLWVILSVQVGILVAAIALWEIAADTGVLDTFFWSKPSAIARTLTIFFAQGDAW